MGSGIIIIPITVAGLVLITVSDDSIGWNSDDCAVTIGWCIDWDDTIGWCTDWDDSIGWNSDDCADAIGWNVDCTDDKCWFVWSNDWIAACVTEFCTTDCTGSKVLLKA